MARGNYGVRVKIPGKGEITRLAGSFNTMAEQVQRSNQVLRDFVANVSHDLRTPLTMVSGFSQALLDGTAGDSEVESSAEIIHEEAGKMQQLVEDLLQLTRLESGLLTLDRQPLEVQSFVQRLLDRAQRMAGDRPIPQLENEVPPHLPRIQVDPMRFERALRNLLDNAMQYTPPDGTVRVSARRAGRDQIEIAVTDTGVGIAPEHLPRIFERFYRTDKSRDRGQGHSGLGLAIVREIVEAHGGRVSAESTPGQGTVFRLTVPVAHEVAARPAREEVAM
jgi:two-component system phosphate regulon sensor histidine kinase PhoR